MWLLLFCLTASCEPTEIVEGPPAASAPKHPTVILGQAGDDPVRGPGLRPSDVSIDPYVLDVDEDSLTIAWSTIAPSIGEVHLKSEHGSTSGSETELTARHRVRIEGLQPGTTYRYEVDGIHTATVRTDRPGASQAFAVFGHPGGTAGVNSYPYGMLAGVLDSIDPDFALCTGDMCYFTNDASYQELYFRRFGRLGQRRAIYPAAGNHDRGFPKRRRHDYSVFRGLFPHDFASERGAYYSFVRGNVHFLSVAYHSVDGADLKEQIAWIARELSASRSEFRIAFLGGANPPLGGGFEKLFKALVDGGVDAVFGGDGPGTFHRRDQGVDYFFAGTNNTKAHDFFLVDAEPYMLRVRQLSASNAESAESWKIPSRREKTIVRDLLDGAKPVSSAPLRIVVRDLDVAMSTFHGIRLGLTNPTRGNLTVLLYIGPKSLGARPNAGNMFRERYVVVARESSMTVDFHVPARNPITSEPWSLGSLEIRINARKDEGGRSMLDYIDTLALFSDPLLSD